MKCDKCDKDATVHMTEVDHKSRLIRQIHLCDEHAIEHLGLCPAPVGPAAHRFAYRHFSQLERQSSVAGAIALGYMISFIVRASFGPVDAIGFMVALCALVLIATFRVYLERLSQRSQA